MLIRPCAESRVGGAKESAARVAGWVLITLAALAITMTFGPDKTRAGKYEYPAAKKQDVVDDYHGTLVEDPYRWLEDPGAEDTKAWVEKQNALTEQYLSGFPGREAIEKRFVELWDYPKYLLPSKEGDRYFFLHKDGLQNQWVLQMRRSLDGEPEVVIDPNTLSEDGTVALTNAEFSPDGRLVVYGLSSSGSDWQELRVRDIDSRKDYDEVLEWCKFSGIGWKHDKSGFFYSRFPAEGEVPEEDRNNYNRVYWHALGTPQSDDELVFEMPEKKELGFWPFTTDDGKYIVLHVYHGTDPANGIYIREIGDEDGEFRRLIEPGESKYEPIANIGSTFYFQTDKDAPLGRIITIDVENGARGEVVPESNDALDFAAMVNERLVVAYMHDAHHRVKIFDKQGEFVRDIDLPTIGSISGLSGRRDDTEMLFSFTSFLHPSTAFRYDFKSDEVSVFLESKVDFDPSGYETKQVFYNSKDGTRVPMFIVHKKGIELDGNNPAILYGYGGFSISLTPTFNITRLIWLESGGVYAVANLRGGDEYGEDWHQAGILDRKQNVFDDFIAAAEYLIDNEYTSSKRLAINGGSNGGLLVAACMVQRPDLFGAVVCQVPVIDMLRYHKFTIGRYWVSDYGNAEENPEHFEFLIEYSPLHNVKDGESYPPTLVTSADTDDRVVPAHAKKFVAELQDKDAGVNPILLRVETKAGHGAGKPTSKIIEEYSDIYAFLFKTLGMEPPNS